jgi:hypothetical protein
MTYFLMTLCGKQDDVLAANGVLSAVFRRAVKSIESAFDDAELRSQGCSSFQTLQFKEGSGGPAGVWAQIQRELAAKLQVNTYIIYDKGRETSECAAFYLRIDKGHQSQGM